MEAREAIIRLAGNLCVRAGAGAGKTGCLVDTYLGLLEQGPGRAGLTPGQIVAITFTNKAADEMRGRIQLKLAQRTGQGGEQARRWAQCLATVEWAPIVTIHSFCVSLLREFGALLELDPEFAVLEAGDYDALLQEVIGDLLRRGLAQGDPVLERLLGTFALSGRGGLGPALERLCHGLSTQGLDAATARRNSARAWAAEMAQGPGLLARLQEAVQGIRAAVATGEVKGKAQYVAKAGELVELWPQLYRRLVADQGDAEVIAQLSALLGGSAWGKINDQRRQAAEALKALQGLINAPACAALSDDLLALAEQLESDLAQELSRRAMLSFDHLLLLGLRLLRQHPSALAELRRRFRAVLVDEFQDVNPVQGRLVFLLAGLEDAAGQPRQPEPGEDLPRLLLVGDPKQSIYAFRGADKKVFDQAQGRVETVALGNNYRSKRELISFFNLIFEQIFQLPEKADICLTEYHVFSNDDQQAPPINPEASPVEPGVVEFLECSGLEPDALIDQWRGVEAQALAARVRALLDQGTPPGDIVILMRAMTRSQVYEQALEQAGVPFHSVGGRGFYHAREVADLALALKTAFSPGDDLALAGALRSRLGGLDDASLLALAHPQAQEYAQPLNRALGQELPDWVEPRQVALWHEWQDLLAWLRAWGRRLTPAELLTGLLESRDLPALHFSTPGGRQRLANLRKLLESARNAASLPPGGAMGFAEHLWELANQDNDDEPLAPLLHEGAQVVRLMAVHQAKGLEFPVVVLADLAAQPPPNGGLTLGPDGVLAAKPWDPEKGQRLESTLNQRLNKNAQAIEKAEAARLFYVACTRAKERLILCRHHGKRQWLWGQWAEQIVRHAPQTVLVDAASLGAGREPRSALPVPVAPYLPDNPGPLDAQGAALVARVLEPSPLPLARVSESVSGLENWLICPRLYLLTRRLGLDTALLAPGHGPSSPGAVNLGSLVHRVLELADLPSGPAGLVPALDQAMAELGGSPEERALAAQIAAHWWDTDLPALLSDVAPHDLHREKPFHLLLPGSPALELMGELDLLARLPSGRWLLVDYKVTQHIAPDEYLTQMALYALALWQQQGRAGEPPLVILCYLHHHGAELRPLAFTPQDLDAWADRALAAAQAIANLHPHVSPSDLPKPPSCACHVAGSGLCEVLGMRVGGDPLCRGAPPLPYTGRMGLRKYRPRRLPLVGWFFIIISATTGSPLGLNEARHGTTRIRERRHAAKRGSPQFLALNSSLWHDAGLWVS